MTLTIRELYVDELNDLYDAEQQILRELPLMAARASSGELRELLEAHYRETQQHISRLAALFAEREERPRTTHCRAIAALIEEGRSRCAPLERGDVLDAALITTARRIEHYEIAAYSCIRTYAATVHDHDAVTVLQESLDEELAADAALTVLADRGRLSMAGASSRAAAIGDDRAPLMPGVWSTEITGFAAVPPRAHSDVRFPRAVPSPREREAAAANYRDNELMVARGEAEEREQRLEDELQRRGDE